MKVSGGSFLAVALLAAACSKSEESEKSEQGTAAVAASAHPAFEQTRAFADRLAAMSHDLKAVGTLQSQPCDDEAIRKALGSEAGQLVVAEYEYLQRYVDPHSAPRYRGGNERWQFLTTPALRKVASPDELDSKSAAVDTAYRIRQLEDRYRYAAIVRVTKRRLPVMAGDEFEAGAFEGWIGIYDLQSGDRICLARVQAQSGPDVAAREGTSAADALWNDFAMRVRRALNESVGGMTRHLRLDLG